MGQGAFSLADVTTSCGCHVEVQVFMCPCGKGGECAPFASAISVVVAKIGDKIFTIDGTDVLDVSDPVFHITTSILQPTNYAVTSDVEGIVVSRQLGKKGKYSSAGWQWKIDIPGGGHLLVSKGFAEAMPNEAMLNVWLTLPVEDVSADYSGLCADECTNLPPLPYDACSTPEEDRCLPIYEESSLVSAARLADMQAQCSIGSPVRSSTSCVERKCGVFNTGGFYYGDPSRLYTFGNEDIPSSITEPRNEADCLTFCSQYPGISYVR